MTSELKYREQRTFLENGNRIRHAAAGDDPELLMGGPVVAQFQAVFASERFRTHGDKLVIPLSFAISAMGGSLQPGGDAPESSFMLSFPSPDILCTAFSQLADRGIKLDPLDLTSWQARVKAYIAANPAAVTQWEDAGDVDYAEAMLADTEEDAPSEAVAAMMDVSWSAVCDGRPLVAVLSIRFRVGKFYRTHERMTQAMEHRVEMIFSRLTNIGGRTADRAIMAWQSAVEATSANVLEV